MCACVCVCVCTVCVCVCALCVYVCVGTAQLILSVQLTRTYHVYTHMTYDTHMYHMYYMYTQVSRRLLVLGMCMHAYVLHMCRGACWSLAKESFTSSMRSRACSATGVTCSIIITGIPSMHASPGPASSREQSYEAFRLPHITHCRPLAACLGLHGGPPRTGRPHS